MATILLRPDLRTAGGESNDILLDGRFVGTVTLVYRESQRIAGAVQLDDETLYEDEKQDVIEYVGLYIQGLIDAIGAEECDVVVTHSEYEDFISTSEQDDEDIVYDMDDDWDDEAAMPMDRPCDYFELMVVGESEDAVEYHIYDEDGYFIAEAFMDLSDTEARGVVDWMFEPLEEEIDGVANLIAADFEEDEYDSFVLEMRFEDELIQTIEMSHEDFIGDTVDEDELLMDEADENDYKVEMVRDDGDTLTYEIYQMSFGGLPIGTATIDLGSRQITGFVDFRNPGDAQDRLHIARKLMTEVDKEKDCDRFNLTMMYENEVIEEILMESEHMH